MTNFELTFTDRETYIEWREQWRAEYKMLSQNIRELKLNIKNTARAGKDASLLQMRLHTWSSKATRMLKQREKSKVLAASQYAQKNNQEAAA